MDLAGVGFSCKCTAQWSGPTCQIKVNQCLLNPCINGACFPSAFTPFYACTCQNGYTGQNCDIVVDNCAGKPCKTG
jgi:hypothetical protein